MKAYAETDIFKAIASNPHFGEFTVKDFAVLDTATLLTWRLAEVA